MSPTAIGYLRRDLSGISQPWDEIQIRSAAKNLGVNLAKTVTFGPRTAQPIRQLLELLESTGATCVICPNIEHLDGAQGQLTAAGYTVHVVAHESRASLWAAAMRRAHRWLAI